jgi:predicted Zn-dependent protease
MTSPISRRLVALTAGAALILAGCAAVDTMVQTGSNIAARQGLISPQQATSVRHTSSAFRHSAEQISDSEEYYLGRAVAAQILARYAVYNDPPLQRYVQTVGEVVALSSDRPLTYGGYHFLVLDTEEINALSAPGGFIFVTRGLVERSKSEDDLACVLAHEVAHVSHKDGLKTIQASRLTTAFTVLATEAGKNLAPAELAQLTEAYEGAAGDIVNKLVVNGYSRQAEYAADRAAVEYARRAGYDPRGLDRLLQALEQAPVQTSGWFKTHPSPESRIQDLAQISLEPAPGYKASTVRHQRFDEAMRGGVETR